MEGACSSFGVRTSNQSLALCHHLSLPLRHTHRPPALAPPRRAVLLAIIPAITALGASGSVVTPAARAAAPPAQPAAPAADNFEPMALLEGKDYGKPRTTLSDFVKTKTGLQVC